MHSHTTHNTRASAASRPCAEDRQSLQGSSRDPSCRRRFSGALRIQAIASVGARGTNCAVADDNLPSSIAVNRLRRGSHRLRTRLTTPLPCIMVAVGVWKWSWSPPETRIKMDSEMDSETMRQRRMRPCASAVEACSLPVRARTGAAPVSGGETRPQTQQVETHRGDAPPH